MEIKKRTYTAELLDAENIPAQLLDRNLLELDFINSWLGGHQVSIKGIQQLIKNRSRVYRVLDIGCGGGDTLRAIANWANKKGYSVELIGLDLKKEAIDYAEKKCSKFSNISFTCADFKEIANLNLTIDICTNALFCHHFDENEIKVLLSIMEENSKIGYVINDLHRHWVAYYSIKYLTALFSRSPLVKNDAPLSVKRGFIRKDWLLLANSAYTKVTWEWAFRFLIVYQKKVKP
jgi:2-polyprenyl-3-methyl-5-hydroxy-6-metoxy-1,4-benzoquinol methylase